MTARPFPVPTPFVIILLVVVSLLVSVPAVPATYVVDLAGNDAGTGAVDSPWRTIQHAASLTVSDGILFASNAIHCIIR
jgi:hypothetical protein